MSCYNECGLPTQHSGSSALSVLMNTRSASTGDCVVAGAAKCWFIGAGCQYPTYTDDQEVHCTEPLSLGVHATSQACAAL